MSNSSSAGKVEGVTAKDLIGEGTLIGEALVASVDYDFSLINLILSIILLSLSISRFGWSRINRILESAASWKDAVLTITAA